MTDPLDQARAPSLHDLSPGESVENAAAPPSVAATDEARSHGRLVPQQADVRPHARPSYPFLVALAGLSLALDLSSKAWAAGRLDTPEAYFHPVVLIKDHLDFVLAKNRGGAWGLLQDTPEYVRRPFFLLVSALAITFIVSLYRRLNSDQWAMRWGLPLVLGGALGNLVDRIRYSHVIDFIHAHASWGGRDHSWPTFNVADIAICVGVGLMAIDMFTSPTPSPAKTANAP